MEAAEYTQVLEDLPFDAAEGKKLLNQQLNAPRGSGLLKFTESNSRENLIRLSRLSKNPNLKNMNFKGYHAHHMIPKEFAPKCAGVGINVNDPHFLAWMKGKQHLYMHNVQKYNAAWHLFFENAGENITKKAIIDFMWKEAAKRNFLIPGLFI